MNSVRDRIFADPVRLVHDKNIDPITLQKVMDKLGVKSQKSLIPGGRYHRRADYMKFPSLGRNDLMYQKNIPLSVKNLIKNSGMKGPNLAGCFFTPIFSQYLKYGSFDEFPYGKKF